MAPAVYVLHVADHIGHSVGFSDSALDVKARVTWAWQTVQASPLVRRGAVVALDVDVQEGTVNGDSKGRHAQALRRAAASASKLLPLLSKAWDPSAPSTMQANLEEKIGGFNKVKGDPCVFEGTEVKEKDDGPIITVEEAVSLPMISLPGTKRAARAMLVAAVLAADISEREGVAAVVLGRPPGHHATCAHKLDLVAPKVPAPGGDLEGRCLGGGCFYPSSWLAAVHSLRKRVSKKIAYIDVDAHKPDGIWKEIECMRCLPAERRAEILGGKPATCEGVLFASVHVNGYPNPGSNWTSASCVLPKGPKKGFQVRIHEELLPKGVAEDGDTTNEEVLKLWDKWKGEVLEDMRAFNPDGIFVGLGFDLHKAEARINDKREGLGIEGQHYREFLAALPSHAGRRNGPLVLTLEGGYTKAAVVDGMRGTLEGLVALARAGTGSKAGKAASAKSQAKSKSQAKPKAAIAVISPCTGKKAKASQPSTSHKVKGAAKLSPEVAAKLPVPGRKRKPPSAPSAVPAKKVAR